MIRERLAEAIRRAIEQAQSDGALPAFDIPEIPLQRPDKPEFGDWSSQIAMRLAKVARMAPAVIAQAIAERITGVDEIERVDVAGGYVNIRLTHGYWTGLVGVVEAAGDAWGRDDTGTHERVNVEFVSANPTGPLHLGHGRWAVVGDAIATVLEATGNRVEREFYINDHGRQMTLFGRSLAARYLQALNRSADVGGTLDGEDEDEEQVHVPEGGYQGAYVTDLANEIVAQRGEELATAPADELVARMREIGRDRMIAHQRDVLDRVGVRFDVWFSETTLHESGAVRKGIETLKEHGHTYEADGALWLRTTDFGDDKDRVVVRASGQPTYFAADIAYFLDKRSRGFGRLIYLWGADHHGYVGRVRAAIQCLDEDVDRVEFLIGQLVNLSRGGEPVKMSKRTGELVTFEELLDEVGADATRYTFLRQGIDTAVDFDIEHAISRSQDNPVFYVQYAHARICSIISYAAEQGATIGADVDLRRLEHPSELGLIRAIEQLPDTVALAARHRAPHRLTRYAEELAGLFHAFYRDCRVVTEDAGLTQARLHLCRAAKIALANVLQLLGVSAPERM